ncbi:MAG: M15 family metallopeptidase [Prevotella sp.]|nr:M15 family metallopeptidase [Prevotella sp.]
MDARHPRLRRKHIHLVLQRGRPGDTAAGFEWGGDWTTRKDYQHFEWIEE